jgi:glutamine cyclotransferase
MKTMSISLFAALALLALRAEAACEYPKAPDKLPDGATATMDEMIAGQQAVKKFDADITVYTQCLQSELDQALATGVLEDPAKEAARKKDLQEMAAKKNNAAVDQAQSLADRFNEQVRTYKAKQKK